MTTPSPTPAKGQQHTPTPWRVNGNVAWSDVCKDRGSVFMCNLRTGTHVPPMQNEANAAFIVRAVNAHEAMRLALEMAEARYRSMWFGLDKPGPSTTTRQEFNAITAALSLSTEGRS